MHDGACSAPHCAHVVSASAACVQPHAAALALARTLTSSRPLFLICPAFSPVTPDPLRRCQTATMPWLLCNPAGGAADGCYQHSWGSAQPTESSLSASGPAARRRRQVGLQRAPRARGLRRRRGPGPHRGAVQARRGAGHAQGARAAQRRRAARVRGVPGGARGARAPRCARMRAGARGGRAVWAGGAGRAQRRAGGRATGRGRARTRARRGRSARGGGGGGGGGRRRGRRRGRAAPACLGRGGRREEEVQCSARGAAQALSTQLAHAMPPLHRSAPPTCRATAASTRSSCAATLGQHRRCVQQRALMSAEPLLSGAFGGKAAGFGGRGMEGMRAVAGVCGRAARMSARAPPTGTPPTQRGARRAVRPRLRWQR